LKVNYRLTAIFNKPFTVLEKLSASTTTSINILEDINVESTEYCGDYKVEKELYLTGETSRPVKVSTVIGKRAAVKGNFFLKNLLFMYKD
jgi:cytoskeletal protein CcmA (bactofilin family)